MRRLAIVLLILGTLAVYAGMTLAASPVTTAPVPQEAATASLPPDGATYVGSDSCFQCHSNQHRDWSNTIHPKMIQDAVVNPDAVQGDFALGEDTRVTTLLGDERSYTVEDVVFTMGTKYRQRYIGQNDDGTFVVLPGQWNVADAQWVTASPSANWLMSCGGCHTTGFDVETLTYSEISVGCEACHGPGSVHIEAALALPANVDPYGDEVYALRQTIVSTVDSAVCGQCHTRGTTPDGTYTYPVGYVVGGPLDDTMFTYATPTGAEDDGNFWVNGMEKRHRQQYYAWEQSGHAKAHLTIQEGARREACMACHSTDYANQDPTFPQDVVTLDSAQFGVTCVGCHAPHGGAETNNQLIGESYALCASCHTGTYGGTRVILPGNTVHHAMREMYEGTRFLGMGPNPSPHFSNEAYGPVCATCHMPGTAASAGYGDIGTHTFHVLLPTDAQVGQVDSCTVCHNMRHDDLTPEDLTFYVLDTQEDTKARIDEIRAILKEITDANPDWSPQAQDKSEEQRMAERIHTLVSFVEADGSWGVHNKGYTDEILSEAEYLLEDLLDMLDM